MCGRNRGPFTAGATAWSACLLLLGLPAGAGAATWSEALEATEVGLSLRFRYESVEDDTPARDANASTLRTTLQLKTGSYRGFRLHLEAENVAVIGDDDTFRNAGAGSRSNGVTDRSTIADVEQTELNQAYISYEQSGFNLTAGRREINLADQRFVGAVGWRQNHQSFDTVLFGGAPHEKLKWTYAYIGRAHRIFGDSREMSTHLFDVTWSADDWRLRGYGLELDYDDLAFAGASTRTLGIEWTGSRELSDSTTLVYELEGATQVDTGDNSGDVDADYTNVAAGLRRGGITAKVVWERLGGSPTDGQFSTPLATLHKFNGWADRFLSTPADGLEDLSLQLSGRHGAWSWAARYHDFGAESASTSYGSEVDLSLSWKSDWGQVLALKVADYQADEFSVDTQKWMLWTSWSL